MLDRAYADDWQDFVRIVNTARTEVISINGSDFLCAIVQDDVQYGVNLDVTSYTKGKRETHNPPGRALPHSVWDFYEVQSGFCTIA